MQPWLLEVGAECGELLCACRLEHRLGLFIEANIREIDALACRFISDLRPRECDVNHYDALTVIRDRFFGLRCAINGAGIASRADRSGLQQLVLQCQ